MAVEILKNGKNPAELPVQYLKTFRLSVNDETAAALGIDMSPLQNN